MDFSQGDVLGMAASASRSHVFPAAVVAVLKSHSGAEGAVDGSTGLAWVFSKKDLLVWMYDEGQDAEVHKRTLPYTPSRRHFVSFALHKVRVLRLRKHALSVLHILLRHESTLDVTRFPLPGPITVLIW